jgi:hypothetical protein
MGLLDTGLNLLAGQQNASNDKKIAAQWQAQIDRANAANNARYNQLLQLGDQGTTNELGALNSQYAQILNMNDQLGTGAAMQRERLRTNAEQGQASQSLTNRGLFNSTIAPTVARGINDQSALRQEDIQNTSLNRGIGLRQQYAGNLLDTLRSGTNRKMGVISDRTDAQPNSSLYSSLMASGRNNNPYSTIANGLSGAGGLASLFG